MAVLFAPDDARARAGAAGSRAVQKWRERAGIGAGAGAVEGTARRDVLGERAREGARAGGATRTCAGAPDAEGRERCPWRRTRREWGRRRGYTGSWRCEPR